MQSEIISILKENPIVASVRSEEELKYAIKGRAQIIFIIHTDMDNLLSQIKEVKNAGKKVFVHVDLIHGFSSSPIALEYIYKLTKPDGILTTKKSIISKANKLGLFSILRVFALDSPTITSASKLIKEIKPNAVEILPGIAPKAIKLIKANTNVPIISGGMIEYKEEIIECLKNGAIAVSTSNHNLI